MRRLSGRPGFVRRLAAGAAVWFGLLLLACNVSVAQRVDVSSLREVSTVGAAWRVQVGEDAAWEQPGFDDSAWPLLKPGELLKDAGLGALKGPVYVTARLHVRGAEEATGIDLTSSGGLASGGLPYAVWADGVEIAESPGWKSGSRSNATPFAIALPRKQDVVVTVRWFADGYVTLMHFPLVRLEAGPLSAIASSAELRRVRNFGEQGASEGLSVLLYLLLGLPALILFVLQRERREYLWLALSSFSLALFSAQDICLATGAIVESRAAVLVGVCLGWLSLLLRLEFVRRFTEVRRGHWLAALEVSLVCGPLLLVTGSINPYNADLLLNVALSTAAIVYCLVRAVRRGVPESRLMLPTFAVSGLMIFLLFAKGSFPALVPFAVRFHFGGLSTDLGDLSAVPYTAGFLAVLMARFVRVSREQQRSTAELEAARTVQQVLIPEELPQIAGLAIASVYKPAQEVGGDFFQILPCSAGAALVVLGDVSGKGLQAAMTVSLLVGALRTLAETTESPAAMLEGLNRRLCGRSTGFTTCLAMRIDADGMVTVANAGHLQPYLEGREMDLEAGLPLGFDPDAEYAETRFRLEAGERLALVTDGVVEAMNGAKELFGFERTASVSGGTAEEIAGAAEGFGVGVAQADDITVLTVERAEVV